MSIIRRILDRARSLTGRRLLSLLRYTFVRRRLPVKVGSYPLFAQIEVTNACNLECGMCSQSAKRWKESTKQRTMTLDEFRHLLDELPGIFHVRANGVGEPLLNANLFDMIALAHRRGMTTDFYTNATLMDGTMRKKLLGAAGLKQIKPSIDTGDPAAYAELRVGASLDAVLGNVGAYREERRAASNQGPEVSVWMTAMPAYIEQLPALIERLQAIGISSLVALPVFVYGDEGEPFQPEDRQRLLDYQREYAREDFSIYFLYTPDTYTPDARTCRFPWEAIYVSVNGDVSPCCFSFVDPDLVFGNLFETTFHDIWNNKRYRDFRDLLRNGLPSICRTCPLYALRLVGPSNESYDPVLFEA
jgi:radical SAM protein with 4Fe4S-binding SPASM domain